MALNTKCYLSTSLFMYLMYLSPQQPCEGGKCCYPYCTEGNWSTERIRACLHRGVMSTVLHVNWPMETLLVCTKCSLVCVKTVQWITISVLLHIFIAHHQGLHGPINVHHVSVLYKWHPCSVHYSTAYTSTKWLGQGQTGKFWQRRKSDPCLPSPNWVP